MAAFFHFCLHSIGTKSKESKQQCCVRACVCVCVCARARACACVCACVRARVRERERKRDHAFTQGLYLNSSSEK